MNDLDEGLDTAQAARVLGIGKHTLAKTRLTGSGPTHCKIGKRVIYRRADLMAFIDANKRRSTSDVGQAA